MECHMNLQTGDPPNDFEQPVSRVSDRILLENFAAGDQTAFSQIMHRHGPYVLGVCQRVTFHAQDAEDVFQACFLELARKASKVRQGNAVAGWLQTVAVRFGLKVRRRRAQRERREQTGNIPEAAVSPDDVSWREVRGVLEEEVARLPEELRLPVIQCLFQGQTQEEAAEYLEWNPRTLKDRLRRGRDLLRHRLTRRGATLAVLGAVLSGQTAQASVSAALQQTTLHGATAVLNHTSLTGVVSPAVLSVWGGSTALIATWGVAAVAFVLLSVGAAIAWNQFRATHSPAAHAMQTVHHSFRNKNFDFSLIKWSGPAPDYAHHEDGGLRLTLPAANGPAQPVGVMLRHPVRGDFELQATFEILRADRPRRGFGSGVTLYFFMDNDEWDGVWFGKMSEKMRGPVLATGHRIQRREERINKFTNSVDTDEANGLVRLRVVRRGPEFEMFAAEGDATEFWHVQTLQVSDADVPIVRFAADPVWQSDVVLDVRLVEFTISAEEFVGYVP